MMAQSQLPWAPFQPGGARPWNLALAAHLLRRAGFGASWSQLQQALADGPERTVDRLLAPPADIDAFEQRSSALGASVANSESAGSDESAQLWLYRMCQTPQPLVEKMTLFWHNYFAIAGARVGKASLMEQHLRLLRRHALGRFDALLRDVCRDPATLIALDARVNRKAKPAEDFAAALLGLYTLGEGHSGSSEVREAARAFTGYSVLRDEFRFLSYEHDDTSKSSADDVLRNLLANPATPRLVVRRMYRWLVSETADPENALIEPLALSFAHDYDIAKLAGTMLRSNHFFSPAAYRQRVKSPLEYALGIAAALDVPVAPAPLHHQLAGLGQRLLEPPTRQGWPGGRRWLNQFTIVGRSNLAATLVPAEGVKAAEDRWAELLLQEELPEALRHLNQPRELIQAIVTLPVFQLG